MIRKRDGNKKKKGRKKKPPKYVPSVYNEKPDRRVTKWNPDFTRQIFLLSLLGATDNDAAEFFNVSIKTIEQWKHTHPDFYENMKKGKTAADTHVAESLYHSAIGYSHPAEKIMANRVKEYKDGKVIREYTKYERIPYTKQYPPNVQAAIKWLSVRQHSIWKDKVEIDANLTIQHVNMNDFTDAELKALEQMGFRGGGNVEEAQVVD